MLQIGDTYESRSGQRKKILDLTGTGSYDRITYKVTRTGIIPTGHKMGIQRTVAVIAFKKWAFKKVDI